MVNAAWKAFFGRFPGRSFEPFLKTIKIYPVETSPVGSLISFRRPAMMPNPMPPWRYVMKNKWVLAAVLAATAVLMYLSMFWTMSEYGPG